MKLIEHDALKFDGFSPLYNWIYPVGGRPAPRFAGSSAMKVFDAIPAPRSRALYVHIPFCDTICSFCPFVRAAERSADVVDAYVRALVLEIEQKGRICALSSAPIGAVFFGGGTPSFLRPEQIQAVGSALRSAFDLSTCREFSFEFEVKTVTPDRVDAARSIGVTHARFGGQTFSAAYRKLFNLTASVEQLREAAALLRRSFAHVSCDMLFGMHGQTEEELFGDVEQACSLGVSNLDFYPLNNLVTQPRLTRDLRESGRRPTSALTKFYMALFVRELLRARGYLPHNGHGYVRAPVEALSSAPLLTDAYSFVYHEHTLGYPDHDLLGFGVNAVSSFRGYVVANTESRDEYIAAMLRGHPAHTVCEHGPEVDACRPIALALPYHGIAPKSWIDVDSVPSEVRSRLAQLVDRGLVVEDDDAYRLSGDGLAWYTNLMFFLLPASERAALATMMEAACLDERRDIESSGIELPRRSLPLVDA